MTFSGGRMTYPVHDAGAPPAVDHDELASADYVEVALEASCAALMALDLVRTSVADDEQVTGRISLAIAALRHVITDLRERQADGASPVSHGFVCGRRRDDGTRDAEAAPTARFPAIP
jgi:hypothetical protein